MRQKCDTIPLFFSAVILTLQYIFSSFSLRKKSLISALFVFCNLPFDTDRIRRWAGKSTSKHPQLRLPSLTLPSSCGLIPLSHSHRSGRVKRGWVILSCPLFSSCSGGILSDSCPSDHLCTAQELDVLGWVSVHGCFQLFSTISEPPPLLLPPSTVILQKGLVLLPWNNKNHSRETLKSCVTFPNSVALRAGFPRLFVCLWSWRCSYLSPSFSHWPSLSVN